jgi:hypothetical protein
MVMGMWLRRTTSNVTARASWDRTIEWEADIVNLFIKTPSKTEYFGHRETPLGTSLFYSAPIRVDSDSCLACHGTPDKAPPEMVRLYGTANGFGWKLHDVVGAQIVSVPANLSDRAADAALERTLWWLAALFGVLFLLVNLIFFFFSRLVSTPPQPPGPALQGRVPWEGFSRHRSTRGRKRPWRFIFMVVQVSK